MSSRYSPHSQRPIYIDYIPAAGAVCGNCGRKLSGLRPAVYFRLNDGEIAPFGYGCSLSRGIKGWRKKDLPNMTLGSDWLGLKKEGHGKQGGPPLLSEDDILLLQHERERREALEYAFLRVVQLPRLGFFKPLHLLRLPCAVTLVDTYQQGKPDRAAHEKTIFMMKRADESPKAGHLTLENLRCCYVVGRQILNIKACGRYLPVMDFRLWRDIKQQLGATLFLDEKERQTLDRLSKTYSPHSHIAGRRLRFRGPGVRFLF